MGDRGWLASFGGRSRTSQQQPTAQPIAPEKDDQTNKPTVEPMRPVSYHAHQPSQHKAHKLVRISSYMGLGSAASTRPGTPTIPEHPDSPSFKPRKQSMTGSDPDVVGFQPPIPNAQDDFFRAGDRTWHSPNLMQMIESVSCTIMKNGSNDTIPRHLNGFVMSMIEEFTHQFSELKELRATVAQVERTRDRELKDFAAMTEEWKTRETNFKVEINRLEHIIADTSTTGVQSVILARAGSVVKRDGRQFREKMNRLSRSEDQEGPEVIFENGSRPVNASPERPGLSRNTSSWKTIGTVPRIIDHDRDVHLSDQLRPTTPRKYNSQHEAGAKLAAARLSANLTDRSPPPAGSSKSVVQSKTSRGHSKSSNGTSSSSSNTSTSSSVSLITRGLLAEKAASTQRTTEDCASGLLSRGDNSPQGEHLYMQDNKAKGNAMLSLSAIQEMAQRLGMPENAIEEDSDCSFDPPACLTRNKAAQHKQRFSFDYGDEGLHSDIDTDLKEGSAPLKLDARVMAPPSSTDAAQSVQAEGSIPLVRDAAMLAPSSSMDAGRSTLSGPKDDVSPRAAMAHRFLSTGAISSKEDHWAELEHLDGNLLSDTSGVDTMNGLQSDSFGIVNDNDLNDSRSAAEAPVLENVRSSRPRG